MRCKPLHVFTQCNMNIVLNIHKIEFYRRNKNKNKDIYSKPQKHDAIEKCVSRFMVTFVFSCSFCLRWKRARRSEWKRERPHIESKHKRMRHKQLNYIPFIILATHDKSEHNFILEMWHVNVVFCTLCQKNIDVCMCIHAQLESNKHTRTHGYDMICAISW